LRYLDAKGYDLVSYDFADWTYTDLKDHITIVKDDIRNVAGLDRAMQGVDFVVHTAAALPLYPAEDIFSTDIDGTRNVLEVAKKHGVKRVVHISSTAVYGIPDHHPLVENDRLDGVGPWNIAPKAWKCQLFVQNRLSGQNGSVFSPCSTIGRSTATTSQ